MSNKTEKDEADESNRGTLSSNEEKDGEEERDREIDHWLCVRRTKWVN